MTLAPAFPNWSASQKFRTPFGLTVVLILSVFFVPMKALALQYAGQSIYLPFTGLIVAGAFFLVPVIREFFRHFTAPLVTLIALSLFYYWQTGYQTDVFLFGAKLGVLFAMAALYVYLLKLDERRVMTFLFWGAAVSICYMVYQAISIQFFGTGLPFTSIAEVQIGRGLGSRYGFVRTTGFTEEPSYVAVMLVGTGLMLRSYQIRSGEKQTKRYLILMLGLLLCTSNSLFATLPLLFIVSMFFAIRSPFLFFLGFYVTNLLVTPSVLNIDETFFARFSSYAQFLRLPPLEWWLGIGFGQYDRLPFPVFVSPDGASTFVVDSIASLWGGILLEGGIVFATLFCLYVARITITAKDATGYAVMAVLIMLANYYSPWWPIVSLAMAYCIVSRQTPAPNPYETVAIPSS